MAVRIPVPASTVSREDVQRWTQSTLELLWRAEALVATRHDDIVRIVLDSVRGALQDVARSAVVAGPSWSGAIPVPESMRLAAERIAPQAIYIDFVYVGRVFEFRVVVIARDAKTAAGDVRDVTLRDIMSSGLPEFMPQ